VKLWSPFVSRDPPPNTRWVGNGVISSHENQVVISVWGGDDPGSGQEVEDPPADGVAGTGQRDSVGAHDKGAEHSELPITLKAQFNRELHLW